MKQIELKNATNIRIGQNNGNVALFYDRPDRKNCVHETMETRECEIESINDNLVTLKYKNESEN